MKKMSDEMEQMKSKRVDGLNQEEEVTKILGYIVLIRYS